MPDLQDAARNVGQSISFVTASTETEIEAAYAALGDKRVSALLVVPIRISWHGVINSLR